MATALFVAGMALAGGGTLLKGKAAKDAADDTAESLRRKAGTTKAIATRKVASEIEKRDVLIGTARAQAGKSGSNLNDKSIVENEADIMAEGTYRALMQMWEGNNEAEGMEEQAEIVKNEGKAAWKSSILQATGTVMKGAASMGMGGAAGLGPSAAAQAGNSNLAVYQGATNQGMGVLA